METELTKEIKTLTLYHALGTPEELRKKLEELKTEMNNQLLCGKIAAAKNKHLPI